MKSEQLKIDPNRTEISPLQFRVFKRFLNDTCGIALGDNKQYLVNNRLTGILEKTDYVSIDALADALGEKKAPSKLVADVIDLMTTNETFWFRDAVHFDELKTRIFAELSSKKFASARIWSAACSSGQEPYSISIAAHEYYSKHKSGGFSNVQIIGTDISESILAQAKQANYTNMALSRGIHVANKAKYFEPNGEGWKLKTEIASRVRFQQFNLRKSFQALGQFDVIFCRNVLIYFSDEVKKDILSRMAQVLKPGGYLFLSSTEAMPLGFDLFELVPGTNVRYYRPKTST